MESISASGLLAWKLTAQLLLPEGLIAACALGALLFAWRGWTGGASKIGAAAVALYIVCACPHFAAWLAGTLERQHPPVDIARSPRADVAIVLGGALAQAAPPRLAFELADASDRVLHAVRLFRAGRVGRIIVVGGNLPWSVDVEPEAHSIKKLMIEWGVPADAIALGLHSRNTRENALEAVALRREHPFASALLVTSALHMPRSVAVFRAAGIEVAPAPCDFRVTDHISGTVLDWLPSARAFTLTSDASREWLGYLAYRLRGWL